MMITLKNPNRLRDIRVNMKKLSGATVDLLKSTGAVTDDASGLNFCLAAYQDSELANATQSTGTIKLSGDWLLELDGQLNPSPFTLSELELHLQQYNIQMTNAVIPESEFIEVNFSSLTAARNRIRLIKTSTSKIQGTVDSTISIKDSYIDFYVGGLPEEVEEEVGEIPSNEMHFTTTEGTIDYYGVAGDQIVLNDGNTFTIDTSGEMYDITVPSGKHKLVLAETRSHGYVGLGGVALVEINNFPTLSSVDAFVTHPNNPSPNLTKVPTTLPPNITNIQYMFSGATSFNQDISSWDVSNVTEMGAVFSGATTFNQDISGWDVSNVTYMNNMFSGAIEFNQDISNWDVSNVTYMNNMFSGAIEFNQDISGWNTSNVTDMGGMFFEASVFNQDISMWVTSNVTHMGGMFFKASVFNQDISSWNVSNVTDMTSMFFEATSFDQDLSSWCVTNITQEPLSFSTNSSLTMQHKPVWGTCPVKPEDDETSSNEMYFTTTEGTIDNYYGVVGDQLVFSDGTTVTLETDSMYELTVPSGKHKLVLVETRSNSHVGLGGEALVEINNFPTLISVDTFDAYPSPNLVKVPTVLPSNITSLSWMFQGATSFNQDISMWDTSNVEEMRGMFYGATSFNQDISMWDTSNVKATHGMFNGATSFNQDISSWNVSNVTEMNAMFEGAIAFDQDLSQWNVSNVTYMDYMFNGASAFNQDLSQWCVSNLTSLPDGFDQGATNWTLPKPVWGTCPRGENPVTIPSNEMYFTTLAGSVDYVGTHGDQILLSDGTTVDVTVTDEQVTFDVPVGKHKVKLVESTDRSNYVSVGGEALVEINNFPTMGSIHHVTFFPDNPSINLIKVPTILPSNITSLENMFAATAIFNQDISAWDTSNVTDMSSVFTDTLSFNQDISSWNVSNVTNMYGMFSGASAFNQDLSGWDTSSVTTMDGMFAGTAIFNQDISAWDTSNVTTMQYMFSDAPAFNQDLSQWCVGLISTPPDNFNFGGVLTVENTPVWGTCPRGENQVTIPSNEMHFTTLAGSVDYVGTQGDQIVLNDGTIVDVTVTDDRFTFDVPAGKHKVVLVETVDRSNYVSVGGEALVELHNFPTLSSIDTFNTYSCTNLVKVPNVLPSNITVTGGMFYGATSFNQDISMWDTGNVTDMGGMFYGATAFDQPLGNWDVSSVRNMSNIFSNAVSFNQPLNSWNVSNVTHMIDMFTSAISFNQDIGNWDVSSVRNMAYMFSNTEAFNQDLFKWNTSNVTDMGGMFRNATAFNQDLSQWCVSNITSLPYEFDEEATNWSLPRPVWGTCPTAA